MAKKEKNADTGSKGLQRQHGYPGHDLLEEMERRFEDYSPRGWMRPFHWDWPSFPGRMMPFEGSVPKVDLLERDDDVVVRAELPGVNKDDLEVSVSERSVTIRASTSSEEKEEKGEYLRRETSCGEFQRTLSIPCEVDETKAKASFKDGLLELTIPKVAGSRRQTVKIE